MAALPTPRLALWPPVNTGELVGPFGEPLAEIVSGW